MEQICHRHATRGCQADEGRQRGVLFAALQPRHRDGAETNALSGFLLGQSRRSRMPRKCKPRRRCSLRIARASAGRFQYSDLPCANRDGDELATALEHSADRE
jgi:hypothetical protein